jgi:hypothetical protein
LSRCFHFAPQLTIVTGEGRPDSSRLDPLMSQALKIHFQDIGLTFEFNPDRLDLPPDPA